MFKQFDEEDAPEKSRIYLENTKKSFGMIPNLERTMAALPELLSVYSLSWSEFSNTPLTPVEQQVVYQTINFENDCSYCVPWHTLLSKQAGMEESVSVALRSGGRLSDPKLQALAEFTRLLVHNRGKVVKVQFDEFLKSGYSNEHALAVVLGIAIKTMSNFTNSIAQTPLDQQVEKYKWSKPTL